MLPLPSRFYPIASNADDFETYVRFGAKFVQIRIKDANTQEELQTEIKRAVNAAKQNGALCVVNDDWRSAIEYQAPFVHLGQEDLQTADLAEIKKHRVALGVSTHDEAELEIALACQPDYIALGPIFHTRLKAMKFSPQGLAKITIWKQKIGAIPLVAIGGLTIERAKACLQAGADAVSVVTDISLSENPQARLSEWLRAIEPAVATA